MIVDGIQLHWHNEPTLLIILLFGGWAYAIGTGPLRARLAPPGTPYPLAKALAFYGALILNYLAVGSPLDQFGEDYLFSLHMLQHLIIVYLTPPLMLWGTPWWLIDVVLGWPWVKKLVAPLVHPAVSCVAFIVVFGLWHLPEFYEAALRSRPIHILEHTMIFVTATQMWWVFLSPSRVLPRCSFPAQLLVAFFLTIGHMPILGLLALSDEPLYPSYVLAPRISLGSHIPSLSAKDDQVLGAAEMEIVAVVFSIGLLGWSFWGWMQEEERLGRKKPRLDGEIRRNAAKY